MELLVRLTVAALAGAVVGLDRELQGKSAGVRTTMLVSLGAAAFAYVSVEGFSSGDPSRVASEIVSGIGFLGAGAIFASGGKPRGLTTAAALWTAAAIGMAAGIGMLALAAGLTVAISLILSLLERVTRPLAERFRSNLLRWTMVLDSADGLALVGQQLTERSMTLHELRVLDSEGGPLVVQMTVRGGTAEADEVLEAIRGLHGCRAALSSE